MPKFIFCDANNSYTHVLELYIKKGEIFLKNSSLPCIKYKPQNTWAHNPQEKKLKLIQFKN